jgi:hypothetical protein
MKAALLVVVIVLAGLQFFRPEKNLAHHGPGPDDLMVAHAPPVEVQKILQRACYDCHSNTTRYPWYAEIQPVGWWLADHIKEGKTHLNFSTFGAYKPRRQAIKLGELIDEVEEGHMPLSSYKLVHPEARLTPAEVKALIDWAEAARDELPEH